MSPVKLSKRATIRWILSIIAIAVVVYFASALIFGRVRARHHFTDNGRQLTVTVRENPNEGWPIDGLAWLGFTPGRHTYWAELRSERHLLATAPKLSGDTYYARQVIVQSADTAGATVFLGNQNGEVEFTWR